MQVQCRPVVHIVLLSCAAVSLAGCRTGEEKYIPSENTAREAVDAALTAWESGQAHGTVTSFAVPIDTFDARWQAGKKLETFEVVREEQSEGHRKFIVNMKLTDDKAAEEVTYLVVGNDPLLVFRQQDYDKASGMGGGK